MTLTQSELQQSQTDLGFSRRELAQVQATLSQTQADLANSEQELSATRANLSTTQANLDQTQKDLTSARTAAETTSKQLSSLQTTYDSLHTDYDKQVKELALYKDTYGSVVASDVQPRYQRAAITNQSTAVNPTWAQLQAFLLADTTDRKPYIPGFYVCTDFAREVHDNAEKAGIQAAWVAIDFVGQDVGHACNAFKTTDRGLVFIDCTGLQVGISGPSNCDKTVNVRPGIAYIPVPLFPEGGWYWLSMGTVSDVEVYW